MINCGHRSLKFRQITDLISIFWHIESGLYPRLIKNGFADIKGFSVPKEPPNLVVKFEDETSFRSQK